MLPVYGIFLKKFLLQPIGFSGDFFFFSQFRAYHLIEITGSLKEKKIEENNIRIFGLVYILIIQSVFF